MFSSGQLCAANHILRSNYTINILNIFLTYGKTISYHAEVDLASGGEEQQEVWGLKSKDTNMAKCMCYL